MTPGHQDENTRVYLDSMRRNLAKTDIISSSNSYRLLLQELLNANPENRMAGEYLLCYDLLTCDLNSFMSHYVPVKDNSDIIRRRL